jgi:hypothetical protein
MYSRIFLVFILFLVSPYLKLFSSFTTDRRFGADRTELCLSSVKLCSDLRGTRSRLPSSSTFLWAWFWRIYSSMGHREGAPCPSTAPGPRASVGSPWHGGQSFWEPDVEWRTDKCGLCALSHDDLLACYLVTCLRLLHGYILFFFQRTTYADICRRVTLTFYVKREWI